jgi:hypothetical protein
MAISISIDDQFLNLGKEFIGLNYQISDIGSIETRQGTFTNDFKIPNTAFNRSALGFASVDNVTGGDYTPYAGIPAKVYQNNILISSGVIQINDVGRDEIDITFYGDNVDVFELIRGKKLREVDLSDLRHNYTAANVIASFNNSSGYIYLPVDYGLFTHRSTMQINEGEIYPAIYVSNIMTAIFKNIGYKIDGTMLDRALYKRSVTPFVNNFFGYSKDFADSKAFYVDGTFTIGAGLTVRHDFSRKIDSFVGVTYSGNDLFNLTSDRYTADDDYQIKVTYTYDFRAFTRLNGSVSAPTLSIRRNGVTIATSSGSARSVSATVTLAEFDYLEFFVQNNHSGSIQFGATASGNVSQKFVTGSVIYPETILPDMDQVDFVKWALFRFLGIISVDKFSKTVYFNQFNDIKNNSIDDWSRKVDYSKKVNTNYSKILSNYAKRNIAQYTIDENDTEQIKYNSDNETPFGAGSFEIDNDFLENEKVIFETPFSGTLLINSFSNNEVLLPYIPRHLFQETFIEFETAQTSDNGGRLQINLGNAPVFKEGDSVEIQDASVSAYNGIWSIYDKVDENTFVLNVSWSTTSSGVIRFFNSEVNIAEPRVLTVYGNLSISQFSQASSINILGTSSTSIPFSYFYKPSLGFEVDDYKESLAFGAQNIFAPNDLGAFDSDYLFLIEILNNPVVKTAYLKINQIDLANLDFLKKKYIERFGGYFYLNLIEDYDGSGDSVKCELVKV